MAVYAIAQLSIRNSQRYQRYVAGFMPILIKYGGRLLAADESPEILEGEWDRHKIIVLAFTDRDSWHRWATSDEYRELAKDRTASTDGPILLVHGI
jgi:uncharacterized protein (DUF1330 family)